MKLTKEVAEQFCRDQSVKLGEFTEISDEAAQALAQHEGELLLYGLCKPPAGFHSDHEAQMRKRNP